MFWGREINDAWYLSSQEYESDDYLFVPTTKPHNNHRTLIFKRKRLNHLSSLCFLARSSYSHFLLFLVSFVIILGSHLTKCLWMANSRSWTQTWPCFVKLGVLNLVLVFKITALGDVSGSVTAENTCKNTNYQSFLPPPYQNMSQMICTPVWHTYELRVSSFCCFLVGVLV